MYNPPDRIQNDQAFGGFIGVEEIYDGESAKKLDLSKFDDILRKSKDVEQKDIVSFLGAKKRNPGSFPKKTKLPKPKTSAPTKNIKTHPGKGTSQLSKSNLQFRLDNIIKQVEQKGVVSRTAGNIGGGLMGAGGGAGIGAGIGTAINPGLGTLAGAGIGALAGGAGGSIAGGEIADPRKKMQKEVKGEVSGKMSRALANDIIKNPHMYKDSDLPKAKDYLNRSGKEEKGELGRIAGTAGGAGIGSAVGSGLGTVAGGLVGGPVGSAIGGGLGTLAGGFGGAKVGGDIADPQEKARKMHKDLTKAKAILSVEKAIHLIKGYTPMSDNAIRKAFGDQVPEQMQDQASRPPQDWMTKCMQEVGDENQCMMMWTKEASQSQAPWQEEKPDANPNLPGTQPGADAQTPDGGQAPQSGEVDYDGLGKWMGGALQGGTLSSLLGHPIAGAAIQAAGKAIGQKILGKEIDDQQAQQIGMAAFDAIEGVINESDDDSMKKAWPALASRMIPSLARGADKGSQIPMKIPGVRGAEVDQKSVVQQLDKKTIDEAMPTRKPKYDSGGESEISGDGAKADLRGLIERSEEQDETGASKKIDAKKIAHNYKLS